MTHCTSEVFDPNNRDLKCTRLPSDKFDDRYSSVGGLINQMPIICGGVVTKSPNLTTKSSDDWGILKTYIDTCSFLEDGTSWKTIKMWKKRKDATIVALNTTTLWILGGKTANTTERRFMAGLG